MSEGFELSIVFAVISAIFVLSLHLMENRQKEPSTLAEELAGAIGLLLSSAVMFLLIHLTFKV
jgi:hypothetical protein